MSDIAEHPKGPVEGLEDEERVEPALEENQTGEIAPWAYPEDARDGASEAATPDAASPAAVGTTPQLADLSGLGVGNEQPAADLVRPSFSQTGHKAAEGGRPGSAEAAAGCSAAETSAAGGSRREGSSAPPASAAAVSAEDSLRGGGEEEPTAEPHRGAAALPAGADAAEGKGCAAGRSKAHTRQAAEQSPPLVAASASRASAAASSAPSLRLTFSAPPKCLQGQPCAAPRSDFSHGRVRLRQIQRDNATLVKRLGEIAGKAPALQKSQAKMDRFRANVAASRASRRRGEAARVMAQNLAIYRRLQEIKPSREVERGRHEKDFAAHEAMLERLAPLQRRAGAERAASAGMRTAGSPRQQKGSLAAGAPSKQGR